MSRSSHACGAFGLTSYLPGCVPLELSVLHAFALGAALQGFSLGARLAVPVAVTAVVPFTFP